MRPCGRSAVGELDRRAGHAGHDVGGKAVTDRAATALRLGLVSEVVPSDELFDTAFALAESIASNPPQAVQASLRTVWAARDLSPQQLQSLGNLFLTKAMTVEALAEGHFAPDSAVVVLVHTLLPFRVFKSQHVIGTERKLVVTAASSRRSNKPTRFSPESPFIRVAST